MLKYGTLRERERERPSLTMQRIVWLRLVSSILGLLEDALS